MQGGKRFHAFPKGIGPKVNVIAWLEFELTYFETAVQHFTPQGLPLNIYSFRVFHISISWWFFTGVWVTASLLKSPGLFSVYGQFSIMLSFGWSPLSRQLPSPTVLLLLLSSLLLLLLLLSLLLLLFTYLLTYFLALSN